MRTDMVWCDCVGTQRVEATFIITSNEESLGVRSPRNYPAITRMCNLLIPRRQLTDATRWAVMANGHETAQRHVPAALLLCNGVSDVDVHEGIQDCQAVLQSQRLADSAGPVLAVARHVAAAVGLSAQLEACAIEWLGHISTTQGSNPFRTQLVNDVARAARETVPGAADITLLAASGARLRDPSTLLLNIPHLHDVLYPGGTAPTNHYSSSSGPEVFAELGMFLSAQPAQLRWRTYNSHTATWEDSRQYTHCLFLAGLPSAVADDVRLALRVRPPSLPALMLLLLWFVSGGEVAHP
jgi:hypothetical protein